MKESLYQFVNGSSPYEEKVKRARAALAVNDEATEDACAAWTWLAYRGTEGKLSDKEVKQLLEFKTGVGCVLPGLKERWLISMKAAEFYLRMTREKGSWKAVAWEVLALSRACVDAWPPCITNVLRVGALVMASTMVEREYWLERLVALWQRAVGQWDCEKHPLRVVELRDDMAALHDIMALAKEGGVVNYPAYDWLPGRPSSEHPYDQLMRKLGAPTLATAQWPR